MSATQKRLASAERAMERAKEENATKKANAMRRAVMAVWSQEALNAHETLKTINHYWIPNQSDWQRQ